MHCAAVGWSFSRFVRARHPVRKKRFRERTSEMPPVVVMVVSYIAPSVEGRMVKLFVAARILILILILIEK